MIMILTHNSGLSISLNAFGASWTSCRIPLGDERREILLGCRETDLPKQSAYLGATVGRYANRIAKATFVLAGKRYHLSANHGGKHTLHGGANNFSYRLWQVTARNDNAVTFTLHSPDGDQGFPGNLTASVTYTLNSNTVTIDYTAACDRESVCSLSNHAYFNLDGQGDARYQTLTVPSAWYLPQDSDGIPNAPLTSVENTPFDFRAGKQIANDFDVVRPLLGGYDHDWLLDDATEKKRACQLQSADKRVTMSLTTTQPALRFYSGNFLVGTPNRHGNIYDNYAGIALETGCLVDSPNHSDWQADCLITPNKPLQHRAVYSFNWRD